MSKKCWLAKRSEIRNKKVLARWIRTVLLSLLFCLCAAVVFADDEKSVISIESAQKTEYKKDAVSGADTIVLTGGVRISVARGSTKTTIFADMVNYNRETDMIYAEGNVQLERTTANAGGESVSAKSLLFNTATQEGIFDNGRVVQTQSDALNLPSGSTLNVASAIFGRDSGGTIAFKNGELTFCDDDDPHWRINARRIWLLPGGEFAFFSALLYVGHVPLLYFPAFYYPKDELIFNPAFGYRNREGYYINTTTYLLGRKPLDVKSSAEANKAGSSASDTSSDDTINFFSLMKTNALKEQVREGLVLHNLDDDYTGDMTNYLKFMADYYANLGIMTGLAGAYKSSNIINTLEGGVRLGFSNTIFKSGTTYLPYAVDGTTYTDASHFLSYELPFRYMANIKLSLSRPFSLTLDLPMYSDPYFDYDFSNRAETMDWIDFLMSNPTASTDEPTISEISSFTWSLTGSYSAKLPEFIKPYINTLSVSSISSSLVFSSLTNTTLESDNGLSVYSPERKFYYPSQITPFKTALRVAGTIFQYPPQKTTKTTALAKETAEFLRVPAEIDETIQNDGSGDAADSSASEQEGGSEPDSLFSERALPLLSAVPDALQTISGVNYQLSYVISPDFTSQVSYASTNALSEVILTNPDDFAWHNIQSTYYQIRSPASLTSALGYRDGFISLTDTFTFSPVYQEHPYLGEDYYSESSVTSIKQTDYNARKLDLTDVNALTIKPFYYTKHFSETALIWNTTLKMIRTKYISDDVENPEWEYLTTDVTDDESFTVHNLNFVLAAKEGNFGQSLSLTTTLPPLVDEYKGVFSLTFPYTTFSIGTGVRQTSKDDTTWIKEDISQSLAIALFSNKVTVTQSWVYNQEESYHDSLRFALSGYGAQLAYTMSYVNGYDFDEKKGWTVQSEKKFQPYSLSFAYVSTAKKFLYWTDRIDFAPTLSTSIVYDYLRPTNSYFRFVPGITFKINNFLNLTFSAESRNDVIYRYFQNYTGMGIKIPGEENVFQDLADSFDFAHEEKRKASGFKLKSLNLSVTHDLHDWDLTCDFSIKPRLVTEAEKSYYDFSPYFSISVAWRPMESMKTQVVDEYGEWELNP